MSSFFFCGIQTDFLRKDVVRLLAQEGEKNFLKMENNQIAVYFFLGISES